MKIETLHFKKKRYFLYVLVVGVLLLLPLVLSITFGKYQTKESIKLVEGTISYKPYDFKIMAMYQKNDSGHYEVITSIPTYGYKINEEKSYCTLDNINKDTNAILKTIGSKHTIENISPNDKCYLYFDKVVVSNIEDIINSKTIARRTDFSTTLTEDTTGTIFVAPDDDGDSFYFAGAVQDNWVKFAGFYWRIIRINGDGTLRMIYSGSEESGPATIGEATQIGTSAFNENYGDNAYVGYMYTSGSVHGTGTTSTIKGVLDSWYDSNLSSYAGNIDTNAGFCGDRTSTTSSSGAQNDTGGTGTTTTWYGARYRLYTNKYPSLKCTYSNDLYTLTSSSKGNKSLSKPIGLITADEVAYAGGVAGTANQSYYLYTSQYYWTMSPCYYYNGYAGVFDVYSSGYLGWYYVNDTRGVRPVINLKSDTQFSSGDGTSSNPYIVS